MTEASPSITGTTLEDHNIKIGSVGKAISIIELRVVDEKGMDLPAGERGEIIAKGPNIMKGYWGRESENLVEGWLYTGDIGYLDEDGYLYVTGRKKNLIISGGKNIYPEEVEEVINNSDLVYECMVRGIENEISGEMVVADVVLKKDVTLEQVKEHCVNHLPLYKVPKKLISCNEIEKNSMNKIKRT